MSWDIRTRIKIVFNTITKKPSSDWEEIILQVLSIDDEATDRALNVCCKVIGYATNGESLFPPLVYYCYNFFIVIILYASTRFLFISITLSLSYSFLNSKLLHLRQHIFVITIRLQTADAAVSGTRV